MFSRATLRDHVTDWVDRAIDVQDGALRAYLGQVLGADAAPGVSSAEAAAALESHYLATTSGAGAAVGGAASIPGIGTGLALGLSMAETVAFLDATALFTLAAAEITGTPLTDLPRRRALLLLALLGDGGTELVPAGSDGTTEGWGRRLGALSDDTVGEINRTAERWLLTRFGTRQGLFVLGRLAPFGIGAAVGAAGNALTAKGVIARVRSAFSGTDAEAPPAAVDATPSEVVVAAAPVDPPTGKYAGLYALLTSVTDDEAELPIAQLDGAVTGGLPAAARRNTAWWGNDLAARAPQARGWLAAGFHVGGVSLTDDTVVLRRGPAPVGATDAGAV